jgi:predicted O-methyltransferase YrrM
VVELGTRTGVSTTALLAGVEARGGQVISVDIEECGHLFQHPQWTFIGSDSRNSELPAGLAPVDVLLIDTEHTYEICSAELALWTPHMRPGGVVLLHDPETFPGVRRAITDFCARTGWGVTFVLPCNGMAIINVPEA